MIPRRGLLVGLGALLAAPAIIRTPGLLMPVKPIRMGWPVHDVLPDGYVHVHGVCVEMAVLHPGAWNDIFAEADGPRYPEIGVVLSLATHTLRCKLMAEDRARYAPKMRRVG